MKLDERPPDPCPSQALGDVLILGNVGAVVIVDEVVAPDRPIDGQDGNRQREAGPQFDPDAGDFRSGGKHVSFKPAVLPRLGGAQRRASKGVSQVVVPARHVHARASC